ncbi:sortase-dependent protein [Streptomyces sp. NBC_01451]|uniref:sortase-dependent protein n=1 Tax=Streptomyces sp. NBC_01451 TaxID=2903872 RepID=UPI002E33DAFA|nr:sortase-dependent protein [Streptomyces sp. NBC_01451]
MSRRLTPRPLSTLRIAVLAGVAVGALLVPATAAFATDPTPTPGATDSTPSDKEALAKKKAEDARALKEAEARKAEAAKAGKDYPRGGVAAGEAPAQDGNTGALIGSATGALLLAGAGTYVLRRRTTARREG